MPAKNVRRAAVSALRAWSKGHAYAENLVERHATRNHLSGADRALLNHILLGVLRNRRLLDHWIGELRKGRLDHETRDVLRVGLCQLLILDIAEHAAVNETVACARSPVRGLINAVLRRAATGRKRLLAEQADLPPPVRYSHPDWLYNRWNRSFGPEDTEKLLSWNNQPSPVYLRLNALNGVSEPADLAPAGGPALQSSAAPGFFQFDGPIPSPWFANGLIYVQDPSTRHAVELLDPRPGEVVLDACAAPGGKASLIAAAMKNEGRLLCTDSNEKRLPRLGENLATLGARCSATAAFDWSNEAPAEWRGSFDAILLDVPCSNTGVLRRRVDARWRLKSEQIAELVDLQKRILHNALPCLKPGGRLVYSTCSIEAEENEGQIETLLAGRAGLELRASHQVLPFRDGFDGAFAARLSTAG